jgi:hypothetical protein
MRLMLGTQIADTLQPCWQLVCRCYAGSKGLVSCPAYRFIEPGDARGRRRVYHESESALLACRSSGSA